MSTQPQDSTAPTLLAIDARLGHVEKRVDQIYSALVGSVDGQHRGLQSRVERLESWAKWLAGLVTTAIGAALTALVKGQ